MKKLNETKNFKYLYHATFEAYKDSILEKGLILPNGKSNFEGLYSGEYIYLSDDIDIALSMAECAENVPEEYLDHIIIFRVKVLKYDLFKDPNCAYTFVVNHPISPDCLEIVNYDEIKE